MSVILCMKEWTIETRVKRLKFSRFTLEHDAHSNEHLEHRQGRRNELLVSESLLESAVCDLWITTHSLGLGSGAWRRRSIVVGRPCLCHLDRRMDCIVCLVRRIERTRDHACSSLWTSHHWCYMLSLWTWSHTNMFAMWVSILYFIHFFFFFVVVVQWKTNDANIQLRRERT